LRTHEKCQQDYANKWVSSILTNYSGGFTSLNFSAGPVVSLGGSFASSSGGLSKGAKGLAPNFDVLSASTSVGAAFMGPLTINGAETNFSKPVQMGKFWAFGSYDWMLFLARQICN
jgi:hypothetical protein